MTLLLAPAGDTDRNVATAVNQALKGKLNSVGTVTLTPNVATTTVANVLVGAGSVILLSPQTAHAASLDGGAYVAPGGIVEGESFTLTHDNNPLTDRTFGYVIIG